MRHDALGIILLIGLVACSESAGRVDYEGDWTYTADGLAGDGYSCTIEGLPLEIADQGSAQDLEGRIFGEFGGSYGPGQMICSGPDGIDTLAIDPGEVDGTFEERAVEILLGSSDWTNTGNLTGGELRGIVFRRIQIDGQLVRLEGTFTGTR